MNSLTNIYSKTEEPVTVITNADGSIVVVMHKTTIVYGWPITVALGIVALFVIFIVVRMLLARKEQADETDSR
jgi:hypothetical protein